MNAPIFLGRTEEQNQFQQALKSLLPQGIERHLPTFSKPFRKGTLAEERPRILLLYGEGGMGKTTLTRRLRSIAETEKLFAKQFEVLFLDWEEQQKLNRDLQVGHDHIRPEAMLAVLHKVLVKAGWGKYFDEYSKQLQNLKDAEAKVEKELRTQPPETALNNEVAKLGAQGIAFVIRQATGMSLAKPEQIETVLKVSAEGLYQARQLAQKALTTQEYEVYSQPGERLAEALGQGIQKLAERKPLVLLLDTYEIVDREVCDYTLRRVMKESGGRTVWVVSGRANLADSGKRGSAYFRGYKGEFSEERLYAKGLSEFSLEEVQRYFAELVPEQELPEEQAEAVRRFSLGIPFVIHQAAVMFREGKPIEEIVEPVSAELGKTKAWDVVLKAICERFLMHCFVAPEREQDLQAIYALAMMRRPDAELLRQMLDESGSLEERLQRLRERYSFIWVEELRLDEKLAGFLREYLLNPVRQTEGFVQAINDRAVAWLELRLEELCQGIEDTAEFFEDEKIADALLDLAHHRLWQGEESGWKYTIPRFIEGWEYDRRWARSLLEIVELFSARFNQTTKQRLEKMHRALDVQPETDEIQALLQELSLLKSRQWFDNSESSEIDAILQLHHLRLSRDFQESINLSSSIASLLNKSKSQLRLNLVDIASFSLARSIWLNRWEKSTSSEEINENFMQTIKDLPTSIKEYLEDEHENSAGFYYLKGTVYARLGHLENAILEYKKSIGITDKNPKAYNALGCMYQSLGKFDDAIGAYIEATSLIPESATLYSSLGNLYLQRSQFSSAVSAFSMALEIDPKEFSCAFRAGLACALQNKPSKAYDFWRQGLSILSSQKDGNLAFFHLYTLALGDSQRALTNLQSIINKSTGQALSRALEEAEILVRCPQEFERLDEMIEMLKKGIEN